MDHATHMRVLEPAPGILAFYDGRIPGHRFAEGPNWVDDGALSLGIASYAILSGDEALIYDSHVSLDHAHRIREELALRGVRHWRVVLSHWHLDHVAGTAAFGDCEVIGNRRTRAHLEARRTAIEAGTDHGAPAICPLVLPDVLYHGEMRLRVGTRHVSLIEANIHSDDATVVWLPEERILLAGDTVEDCVTYVGAPEDFAIHRHDLARLADLEPERVLPCHGDPHVIAGGGYGPTLLAATDRYIAWLMRLADEPDLASTPMAKVIEQDVQDGTLHLFAGYEAVHGQNIARTLAAASRRGPS